MIVLNFSKIRFYFIGLLYFISILFYSFKLFADELSNNDKYSNYSSIAINGLDRKLLFNNNGDKPIVPASLVKIATIYTALSDIINNDNNFGFYSYITIPKVSVMQPRSKINFKAGEKVSFIDLISAGFIASGNDAMVAIANHFGGICPFISHMNSVLPTIGMKNSKFSNPTGLNDWRCKNGKFINIRFPEALSFSREFALKSNSTTARDIAYGVISLIKDFPYLNHFFTAPYFVWKGNVFSTTNNVGHYLKNSSFGKTGNTNASGFNLVSSINALYDNSIVSVVTGITNRFQRDDYMTKLIKYANNKSFKSVDLDNYSFSKEDKVIERRKFLLLLLNLVFNNSVYCNNYSSSNKTTKNNNINSTEPTYILNTKDAIKKWMLIKTIPSPSNFKS